MRYLGRMWRSRPGWSVGGGRLLCERISEGAATELHLNSLAAQTEVARLLAQQRPGDHADLRPR
jgi:hypothetical protein